jgi:hypothetical protein
MSLPARASEVPHDGIPVAALFEKKGETMVHDRGAMLVGMGIGASLMYFLDPNGGGRRRALVRDKVVHAGHVVSETADATSRDVANRVAGVTARIRGARHNGPVDDRVLAERIRAQLGRVVSHPRAIDANVSDGVVTLRGAILQSEVERLCEAVVRIGGVREVVDELDAYTSAENVPALQGGHEQAGIRHRPWSPTKQLVTCLAATAGLGLIATAAAARS